MPTQPSIRLMSCATAIRPARIERKPLQRSRIKANVLSRAHTCTHCAGRRDGLLTELRVARPVPLVFNCPAQAHKSQQRFRAGAQGGDKEVNVVKRLAVTPAGADQLDDPAGLRPALTSGVSGIAGTQHPVHLAAMAVVGIADHHREVPVAAELGGNLPIQPALVVFDRQKQVDALLRVELKNAGAVW